jgi:hypothetical protein
MENSSEASDLYKVVRAQIEHLDNTISQRIIWLVLSQSFFVSGYAILITGIPKEPNFIRLQAMLVKYFPIVSSIMVILSFFDIMAGMAYMKRLKDFMVDQKKGGIQAPMNYPPVNGFKMLNGIKNLSPIAVPVVFIAFWIFILSY